MVFCVLNFCTKGEMAAQTFGLNNQIKMPNANRTASKNSFFIVHTVRRILSLPPERGRSPPAARRSVEVVWGIPEPFHQLCCCGPGLRRAEVASSHAGGTVRGPAVAVS